MTINYVPVTLEQIAATDTTVYTCPAGVSAAIIYQALTNCPGATGSTVTVNIVKSGGSVAATNEYTTDETVAAGAAVSLSKLVNVTLSAGDFISTIAADAARLNLKMGVKEIS